MFDSRRAAILCWLMLLPACGGSTDDQPGSTGGGDAGTDAGDVNQFPCGTAQALAGGFERCDTGYVRRPTTGSCPSTLPRTDAVPGYNPTIDECQYDSDCSSLVYGHCGQRPGGFARACVAGCVQDGDCATGNICYCGDPVGRCVPASCTTDADCQAGFNCAGYDSDPGCFSVHFACQLPSDSCAATVDCNGFSVNPSFCYVDNNGSRTCTTYQCTMP